ncbi:fungal-specific transcription factor domain-containing protein [Circinella umbellata]|nr:fungal-specific transcription factor domain-containing protein [Circinella umbellata]
MDTTNTTSTPVVIKEEDEPSVSSAAPCSPNSQQIIDEADRFRINEIGQAMYVNDIRARIDRIPSIHSSSLSQMDSIISPSFGSKQQQPTTTSIKSENNNDTDRSSQKMDTDTGSEASSSAVTALPHDVPQSLIKTYFEHVHKYVPMIHNPYFYKQLSNKVDPPSPLLLYAMCAVASRWTGEYTGAASGQIAPGFSFYQRAFAKIDEYSDAPRVSTIQALLLLTKYQEYYRRLGFFHRPGLYLGMAVRMCNDLGLPKLDSVPGQDEDPQEHEEKKRTFWMVFIYDLMMSIEQGREPYFASIECTTEYPLATSEEGPYLEEVVTNNNVVIQLARILSDILLMSRRVTTRQHVQGDQRTQVQIIEEQGKLFLLNTHLENFVHELPAALSYGPTQSSTSTAAATSSTLSTTSDNNSANSKQPISNVFVGFLHMTYHFSVILLHRHYVLHPLPSCDLEMEPYQHQQMCAASASNITQIAETILESQAMDAFSYPTRGIQHTIHCVTMAATVHRDGMSSQDNSIAEQSKHKYVKALNILNQLAAESPAMEFHSHIKEAELAQINNSNNTRAANTTPTTTTTTISANGNNCTYSSPIHSSNASTTSSTDSNFVSSSTPPQQQQPIPPDHVSLSDASSTSSSPRLSSSVDMPTRAGNARPIKLPKSRRHTLTGTGNTQLMQMAKHPPLGSQWQHSSQLQPQPPQQPPQQQASQPSSANSNVNNPNSPYWIDSTPFSQASLLNSSATISDPSRFASLMMQGGVNLPLYNHHQQPLPHTPQQQQPQPHLHHPQQHPQQHFASSNPPTYRKSRLSHHWSYSQEDLRSLRRAQMNKPIGGGSNWPSAQARTSPHLTDFNFGNHFPTDMGHHDSFPNPYPQQQHRMNRQLRRQSSMTMMPSYYAQRQQQQQHYMPSTAPLRHAPPSILQQQHQQPPPSQPHSQPQPVPRQQQQQQQPHQHPTPQQQQVAAAAVAAQHQRRHTISVPASGAITSVTANTIPHTCVTSAYNDPTGMIQQQEGMGYLNYPDVIPNDTMMNMDSGLKLDNHGNSPNDYLGFPTQVSMNATTIGAGSTTPSVIDNSTTMSATSTMDTSMMVIDPPTNDQAQNIIMNDYLMGDQWSSLFAGSNPNTTSNPGFEDLQRSEGHVM